MQLKAQYPDLMQSKAMTPPAKHPLMLGDKRDLLERRREELEQWLWRLIATPDIARSNQLKAFLEYGKALQRAQKARCADGCLCCRWQTLSTGPCLHQCMRMGAQ